MNVKKRNGKLEEVSLQKISNRLKAQCYNLNTDYVDYNKVAKKVVEGLYEGVSTIELDELAAETAASMIIEHPDYSKLASRICLTNLYKQTNNSFSKSMKLLYNYNDEKTGEFAPLINDLIYKIVCDKDIAKKLDDICNEGKENDKLFDYFGFKTLERAYLLRCGKKIIERPQYMYMRVALALHSKNDIEKGFIIDWNNLIETYNLISQHYYTHATPTLFNAGTQKQQLSSCFLLSIEDSIEGIYKILSDCAKISQNAGGIGLSIHNVRSTGSYIKGTGGTSSGIVPMLKNFNETARYVDQGGNKRKGSFAIYLEPWHADIFEFLDLKKNHGKEEMRARDLFYAMWIPDLFMERVKNNEQWTLFDPNETKELYDTHSEQFNYFYEKYESEGKGVKTVNAQELWFAILNSQIETGTPYMLYKDAANSKSNQQNLGTIRSSNLCAEILLYTNKDEIAVCNLASIALPKFIIYNQDGTKSYDFKKLIEVSKIITTNLNTVIDINYYPVPETEYSNLKHRPLGIGVQGLADTYAIMGYNFDSDEAKLLNKQIFEAIYYGCLLKSNEIAKENDHYLKNLDDEFSEYFENTIKNEKYIGAYKTFEGSPLSQGKFQFDLWEDEFNSELSSDICNWDELREKIIKYGVYNSMLTSEMPTASSSQIMGNNECFEPFTSNLYTRRTLSGEFIIINKHLVKDLIELNLWDNNMKNMIMASKGSIQNIEHIPIKIRNKYKTAYELSQRTIIDQAADRGKFICQTQSMNLFVEEPTLAKLSSMHFYGWNKGLKTGMYYLRSKAAVDPIQFTLDKTSIEETNENDAIKACRLDDPDCLACGA